LTGFLLVVILGMAAFAVDTGYIVLVQSQLQNAADAAALAGAQELMKPYVEYNTPNPNLSAAGKAQIMADAMRNAVARAKVIAALNQAGDVNSLTVLDDDVVCGFLDGQKQFWPTPPDAHFPNSVRVTVRRDKQANNPLGLLFGNVFGVKNVQLTATGRGTSVSAVTTFTDQKSSNAKLLPVAVDIRVWNQFLRDGTSFAADNKVVTGPNGLPQLQIYPDLSPFGSRGLVPVGLPANSATSFREWIDNGQSAQDLQYLRDSGKVPVSPTAPQDWAPGMGLKSTLGANFMGIIGQPRLVPLYDGSLNPNNYVGYPIIGFAGIYISAASGEGGNMIICIQPMFVLDPTTFGGSPTGTTTTTFAFQPPQLTQ
jgi:Flp pilus assembly protein TadG